MGFSPTKSNPYQQVALFSCLINRSGIACHIKPWYAYGSAGTCNGHSSVQYCSGLLFSGISAMTLCLKAHTIHATVYFRNTYNCCYLFPQRCLFPKVYGFTAETLCLL